MAGLFDVPEFPRRVLVIEDELGVRLLLEQALATRGLEVISAPTGEQGIALAEEQRLACLITDKNLPGMDGIEVMRIVRRMQPFCACVVITAYASKDSAVEALNLGAAEYLEKPFHDIFLVCERIDRIVEKQRVEYELATLLEQARAHLAEVDVGDRAVDVFNALYERVRTG